VYRLIDEAEEIFTQGNHKRAIATIKKAIELNPNSDDAYVDLGMTYTKMGNAQEAKKAFNKAISLNPNMKAVISQLTEITRIKKK
jgi:Flp pilus assembly protein TadD